MSLASESRHKYGVIAAGAVSKSFIAQLPAKSREIGPVAGTSFRVASRMANSLRAGYAVRSTEELQSAAATLFFAPSDQSAALAGLLAAAPIEWAGRPLVVCDSEVDRKLLAGFEQRGASVAIMRDFGMPRQIAVEGSGRALMAATQLARSLKLHVVEIAPGTAHIFDAAVTMATAGCTPLIDRTVEWLRMAGIRDVESARLGPALFEIAARGYAHSGKQSWKWYVQAPDADKLLAELRVADPRSARMFRDLLIYGLEIFEKHPEAARALRIPELTSE